MNFVDYCTKTGLGTTLTANTRLTPRADVKRSGGDVLNYSVPELTPDGTCSVAEKLAAEPYDLRRILHIKDSRSEGAAIEQINALYGYIAAAQRTLHADWLGIYQSVIRADGVPVLVKLAYVGKPSRAEFPLTDDFALLSNNSKVGLTGKAVLIKDVAVHEGPYYICDGLVQSELCLPIFNRSSDKIIGIIDAESFEKNHFSDDNVALAVRLCLELADILPLDIPR